jgi:hypothetical protein
VHGEGERQCNFAADSQFQLEREGDMGEIATLTSRSIRRLCQWRVCRRILNMNIRSGEPHRVLLGHFLLTSGYTLDESTEFALDRMVDSAANVKGHSSSGFGFAASKNKWLGLRLCRVDYD